MTMDRNLNLVMVPDYLSAAELPAQVSGAIMLGDANKVPSELRGMRFFDVNAEKDRQGIMLLVPKIGHATVITPSLGYYRRLYELRDDCFFCNLTLRLITGGVFVSIVSGMQSANVPPQAAEWTRFLAGSGVKLIYDKASVRSSPASELITAADVVSCARQGRHELFAAQNAIITPYAKDEAKERGVTIYLGKGGHL